MIPNIILKGVGTVGLLSTFPFGLAVVGTYLDLL
jgi:hypothetical protein